MKIYRLTRSKWKFDLSGKGGEIEIGRWHKNKVPILYASESLTLAACEVIMHEDFLPTDKYIQEFTFKKNSICTLESLSKLDKKLDVHLDWRDESSYEMRELIRQTWMNKTKYSVLRVPTVITPGEYNFLIRPGDSIKLSSPPKPFDFDPRFTIQPAIQYTQNEKSEIRKQIPIRY